MEVPRLGAKLELQLPAYTTAMRDTSCIWDLHHSSWQPWILHPLSKARYWTCNLMVNWLDLFPLCHNGNSCPYTLKNWFYFFPWRLRQHSRYFYNWIFDSFHLHVLGLGVIVTKAFPILRLQINSNVSPPHSYDNSDSSSFWHLHLCSMWILSWCKLWRVDPTLFFSWSS